MKYLTTKDIKNWLNISPISITDECNWTLEVTPLTKSLEYLNPNKILGAKRIGEADRVTVREVAKAIHQRKDLPGLATRYYEALARNWVPVSDSLTIVISEKEEGTIVWDGSSRLTALALAIEMGLKPRLTHIGVLRPNGRKR